MEKGGRLISDMTFHFEAGSFSHTLSLSQAEKFNFVQRNSSAMSKELEKGKVLYKTEKLILIIINEICGSDESLFLRNYTTNFAHLLAYGAA